MTPPLTAILFDFGGTLDSDGVAWKERFRRLCREEGLEVENERFDRAFYAADDVLVGSLPADCGLRETVGNLARGLVRELGADDPRLASRLGERFCADAEGSLRTSAGLLERLAPRYRLGVVSNFYGNLSAVCAEAGLSGLLSAAVDSARIGFVKPDPRIFREALKALAARPEEAVFVGDSVARDMAGARDSGMRHIWLKSADCNGADHSCCPGDPVIRRLAELEEIVP